MLDMIRTQWRTIPPVLTTDLSGRTVILIGANTGIGLEATKHFARMKPARLIMGCRNEEKGKTALAHVEAETGYKAELWLIDLSSFASVSEFATRFEQEGGRLDYLVMNAGIAACSYEESKEGYEMTVQVNHLSTSLLTLLLVPTMARTARETSTSTRVVIVASVVHFWAIVPKEVMDKPYLLDYVNSKEYCTPSHMLGMHQYNISKLFNVLFARAFAAHFSTPGPPITITSVNPGYCVSELRRDLPTITGYIVEILNKLVIISAEAGSRMLVQAAIWDKGHTELNGEFLSSEVVTEPSDLVISEDGAVLQEKIWKETISILAKADPRVSGIARDFFTPL